MLFLIFWLRSIHFYVYISISLPRETLTSNTKKKNKVRRSHLTQSAILALFFCMSCTVVFLALNWQALLKIASLFFWLSVDCESHCDCGCVWELLYSFILRKKQHTKKKINAYLFYCLYLCLTCTFNNFSFFLAGFIVTTICQQKRESHCLAVKYIIYIRYFVVHSFHTSEYFSWDQQAF